VSSYRKVDYKALRAETRKALKCYDLEHDEELEIPDLDEMSEIKHRNQKEKPYVPKTWNRGPDKREFE
jgi:hypothetical protein